MRRCASGRSWPPDDMTDLQFGLLLIGAVAVAAVLIYNRLQERAAGRRAERTFGSRHADALLGETGARREPAAAPRKNAMQSGALPDARLDYVVDLAAPRGIAAASLLELWAPLEHRFAKRVLLAASKGGGWRAALASWRLRMAHAWSTTTAIRWTSARWRPSAPRWKPCGTCSPSAASSPAARLRCGCSHERAARCPATQRSSPENPRAP